MKKYTDSVKLKVKRLILSCLGQLIWLIPLGISGWYAYTKLPEWSESYFGVSAAQRLAREWDRRLVELSDPVLWNPSAIAGYLKALFISTATASKAYTLAVISGMVSGIGQLVLNILGALAIIYGFIRMKRAYRLKSQMQDVTFSVCQIMLPEIEKMQVQIAELIKQVEQLNQKILRDKEQKK